jgi:hypothetical protein
MAFDFPANPVTGQEFLTSGGVYAWNGYAWSLEPMPAVGFDEADFVKKAGDTMLGVLTLAADPLAPLSASTKQYVDAQIIAHVDAAGEITVTPPVAGGSNVQTALQGLKTTIDAKPDTGFMYSQDALRVAKAGDTMTGPLILNAAPTADMVAANKKYVDDRIAGAGTGATVAYVDAQDALKVSKSGDTMTGNLGITNANPDIDLNKTASGGVCQTYILTNGVIRWLWRWSDADAESGSNAGSSFTLYRFGDAGTIIDAPITINRQDGRVLLNAAPISTNHAATKGYVDTVASNKVSKAGDTMSGDLTIDKTAARIHFNKTDASAAGFVAWKSGLPRWDMLMGNTTPESGGDAGCDFQIDRYSDAGTHLGVSFTIYRATGLSEFSSVKSIGLLDGKTLRSSGASAPASGVGVELLWDGTSGYVFSYDRTASAHKPLILEAQNITLNPGTGSVISLGPIAVGALGSISGISAKLNVLFAGDGTQYGIALRPVTDNTVPVTFQNAADTTIGTISTSATGTAYVTSSDARLKEDLKSFDAGNIIDNIEVYDFKWKSTGERDYGVIAQQAVEVYPSAVVHTEIMKDPTGKKTRDEFWGVDYSKYVPVLLQELKALRARVAQLEGKP